MGLDVQTNLGPIFKNLEMEFCTKPAWGLVPQLKVNPLQLNGTTSQGRNRVQRSRLQTWGEGREGLHRSLAGISGDQGVLQNPGPSQEVT